MMSDGEIPVFDRDFAGTNVRVCPWLISNEPEIKTYNP